jgi:NADPH-dependent 2,4-dienoyl-CoA reductase/sulfur reductase-like enzyme
MSICVDTQEGSAHFSRGGDRMRMRHVVIIGAGVGGLTAALRLAAQGVEVTVVESAAAPGGKMREVMAGGVPIDSGPTVPDVRGVPRGLRASQSGLNCGAPLCGRKGRG